MRRIWELAGILGVDPGPLTLRELVWMYAGRRREHWLHTAHIMALLANCHRDPKRMRRPFDVADFLPLDLKSTVRRATGLRLTARNLRLLKPLFDKKRS
jgi:hypothetical protein